jgi:hypothetical protein
LPNEDTVNAVLENLYAQFFDAKIYGSILRLGPIDEVLIEEAIIHLRTSRVEDIIEQGYLNFEVPIIEELLEQYKLLTMKYDIVVTNPPYMGGKGMHPKLTDYVRKYYPNTKSDLFAVFMDVSTWITKNHGYYAMINQQSWMFLSTFERLREFIIENQTIINMAHTGTRTFPEIGGEVVQNTAFIIFNFPINKYEGRYSRLTGYNNTEDKALNIGNPSDTYFNIQSNYMKVPSSPIAYWVSRKISDLFSSICTVENFTEKVTKGIFTGDNGKYLKLWHEVNLLNVENGTWHKYSKGGGYRKWYGNSQHLVFWKDNANELRKFSGSGLGAAKYYDLPHIVWSGISTGKPSFRYEYSNVYFDDVSPAAILKDQNNYVILAQLNSVISEELLKIIAPTMHFQIGDIKLLPLYDIKKLPCVAEYVNQNIEISRLDWDSFEISWDFEQHPLTMESDHYSKISEAYATWNTIAEERFNQLKNNEEELNRIFIDIYGLQDELTPEVEDKDVTIRKADVERDVRSFLSYLVGVIFGRYRLDKPGLAFAGGEFNLDKFGSYKPDKDNIIPITAEHYFEDDIVSKIAELVAIIYGEDTLTENLQFIATTLGMKESETAEDTIRRYFMKDFYKDHLKIYQKRPIYWQFSSGKKGAFKGLMYLHGYDKYTLARIRTDYVLKLTTTLNQLIEHAQVIIDGNISAKEVARARKEREAYEAQLQELREYDLILKQLADQEIDLDLDDGVKVNYAKFQEIPFKKDNGRSEKMNLFEKI